MVTAMIHLETPVLVSGVRQFFNQKVIEAFALGLGFDSQPGIEFWRQAQHEAIGFGSAFKIKIDRLLKSFTNLLNRVAVESDDVIDAGNTANQAFIRITIFYAGGIAAISQGIHGVTPNRSKNSLAVVYHAYMGMVDISIADIGQGCSAKPARRAISFFLAKMSSSYTARIKTLRLNLYSGRPSIFIGLIDLA